MLPAPRVDLLYTQFPIELSPTEWTALEHGEPPRVRVNDSPEAVLLLAEQYERLKEIIEFADVDPQALYPVIADITPDDWEDLSAYPHAEKP
jgi:hypothetical protein